MKAASRNKKHKPTPKDIAIKEPMPAEPNRLNVYTCQANHEHKTVTIDRHKGVTPFMIDCTVPGCKGTAYSSFYKVNPELIPTHEWYYPTSLKGVNKWEVDHVKQGGLLFREIPK